MARGCSPEKKAADGDRRDRVVKGEDWVPHVERLLETAAVIRRSDVSKCP